MVIKALSLWEPWASLMRCGAKTIETRSRYTAYRGPLLICGAKAWSRQQDYWLRTPEFQHALSGRPAGSALLYSPLRMLLGKAACVVDLTACYPTENIAACNCYESELAFGDFSDGRYGWVTNNRRVLDPFPVRGRQGLFDVEVPDELLRVA